MDGEAPITPPGDPGGAPPQAPGTPPALTSVLSDEGLKAHQGLSKFKDVDSLAKSYIELDKLRNERTGVKPLTPESTPEEIAAYRAAMGIPDAPEKYELGELSFPEGLTPTQEQLGAWRQTFHALHLSPAQVQGIMQAYAQEMSQNWTALEAERQDSVRQGQEVLQRKYGAQMVPLIKMAQEYVRRRYGEEALETLDFGPSGGNALGNNPLLIELLIESARLTGHDKFIMADSRGTLVDKQGAEQKLNELYARRAKATDPAERAAINAEIEKWSPLA